VIGKKGLPCQRRWLGWPHPILLHRRFGDVNAHLPQFPHNPGRAPHRVRLPHVSNQLAYLLGHGRATRRASLAQASPVVAKALMLPGEDRAGLDQGEYFWPAGREPSEPRPEQAIGWAESRAIDGLLIDRALMPQRKMFQTERCA